MSWRSHPPVLRAPRVTLREPRLSDATALLTTLAEEEVGRFIPPPPGSVDALERFITLSQARRAEGRSLCLAVVPDDVSAPVGLFQIRQLAPDFTIADWGFAISPAFWGGGLFYSTAPLVIDFAFSVLGVQRLEARAAAINSRGNGALRKLGAEQEALLRRSLLLHGEYIDQALWTFRAEDWRARLEGEFRIH
jgi:[ribosomal protein S5]-alanine N-acetyltransferase